MSDSSGRQSIGGQSPVGRHAAYSVFSQRQRHGLRGPAGAPRRFDAARVALAAASRAVRAE
eukprot:6390542-Prymnesium_polylepis.1